MDYLQLIAEKPPQKAALITEEHTYTYGELAALARERRKTAGGARRVYFIKKSAIAQQLIEFIAFAGTDNVPVLGPQVVDTEHLEDIAFSYTPLTLPRSVYVQKLEVAAAVSYTQLKLQTRDSDDMPVTAISFNVT